MIIYKSYLQREWTWLSVSLVYVASWFYLEDNKNYLSMILHPNRRMNAKEISM